MSTTKEKIIKLEEITKIFSNWVWALFYDKDRTIDIYISWVPKSEIPDKYKSHWLWGLFLEINKDEDDITDLTVNTARITYLDGYEDPESNTDPNKKTNSNINRNKNTHKKSETSTTRMKVSYRNQILSWKTLKHKIILCTRSLTF